MVDTLPCRHARVGQAFQPAQAAGFPACRQPGKAFHKPVVGARVGSRFLKTARSVNQFWGEDEPSHFHHKDFPGNFRVLEPIRKTVQAASLCRLYRRIGMRRLRFSDRHLVPCNYLPGCLPPCADWKTTFTGACADAETAVGAGRPKACGPKWATSVAGAGSYVPLPLCGENAIHCVSPVNQMITSLIIWRSVSVSRSFLSRKATAPASRPRR